MSRKEVEYLVGDYFRWGKLQMSAKAHKRLLKKTNQRHEMIKFIANNLISVRTSIVTALDIWTDQFPTAQWVKAIKGLGPVYAAGLTVLIDITKAKTPSAIWAYAGLTPHSRRITDARAYDLMSASIDKFGVKPTKEHCNWIGTQLKEQNIERFVKMCQTKKGTITWPLIKLRIRRKKFNPLLNHLSIQLRQSFVFYKNGYYGQLYRKFKQDEIAKNEAGRYKYLANKKLKQFNYREETIAYQHYIKGKLPPAHLDARAKLKAVKVFLAHYWQVCYYAHYKKEPPDVYAISVLGGYKRLIGKLLGDT